eukprot:scaffold2529_cov363-Prasinococcus_capsulatus_cf.AAC.5
MPTIAGSVECWWSCPSTELVADEPPAAVAPCCCCCCDDRCRSSPGDSIIDGLRGLPVPQEHGDGMNGQVTLRRQQHARLHLLIGGLGGCGAGGAPGAGGGRRERGGANAGGLVVRCGERVGHAP